jgi:hypothetical protein
VEEPYILGVPAQPGIAADRFAREIVGFLNVVGSALAAAECQSVGPLKLNYFHPRLPPVYEECYTACT